MKTKVNLKGVAPAAVLPLGASYQPDFDVYGHYLEWLVGEGAVAFAVNMDTGEGPQISLDERLKAVEVAVSVASGTNGKVSVLAGVMGATTRSAVDLAGMYREAGADALVVFPNAGFRNDPLDPIIPYHYHKAIADESGLPIILFQLAPVFGGVNYSRQTLLKLLEIPQVIGIKEASFDYQYFKFTKETLDMAGRDITLMTGNDIFITETFQLGAEGALLGFAAIGCGMVAEMNAAFLRGDDQAAAALKDRVQGFANVIYTKPMLDYRARCKAALAHIGVIPYELTYVHPPLLSTREQESAMLKKEMEKYGMFDNRRG
jgi:4-hydroxy-tetrahydrodipicolinate synthase